MFFDFGYDWAPLLAAWTAYLIAAVLPGPNMFAVVQASISGGRGPGLSVALGIACMALIWMSFSSVGLASLFLLWPEIARVVGVLGGGWLIYLGFAAILRAWRGGGISISNEMRAKETQPSEVHNPKQPIAGSKRTPWRNPWRGFFYGLGVSSTNPKGILFFVSLSSLAGVAGSSPWRLLLLVTVTGCLSLLVYGTWGLVFSHRSFRELHRHHQRWMEAVFGSVFASFGLVLWAYAWS